MSGVTRDLLEEFAIVGELKEISELKRGHINTTYASSWSSGEKIQRYVHQRINQQIFRDLPLLVQNIVRVTNHLRKKFKAGQGVANEQTLTLVPTRSGEFLAKDKAGESWRTYEFVENTKVIDFSTSPDLTFHASAAFGRFLALLSDLPVSELGEPIPRFQDSVWRFDQLDEAVKADKAGRAAAVSTEINFALGQRSQAETLKQAVAAGGVVIRPTHADPKLNNVLFDVHSSEAVCIVDLDTCMPGTVLYDFGDLARNTAVSCAEDEQDFSLVRVDPEMFEAVARGYLGQCAKILTPQELKLLPDAPGLLALTLGVRFLADHLNGDTYFRVHHSGHNLERARTQFQIFRTFAAAHDSMTKVIDRCSKR